MAATKKRRSGRPRKHAIAVACEGQRLLLERTEKLAELARMVGVAEQRIDEWRSGRARPSSASAKKLRGALAIPLDAWTRKPGTATPPAPAPASAPAPSEPAPPPRVSYDTKRPSSLEEIDEMLAALRVPAEDLTDRDEQKRIEVRTKLLGLKARIEHQERLAEDAIVRAHPHWRRIREALREALAPYPEALAAVHERLVAIGEWETAVRDAVEADEGEDT